MLEEEPIKKRLEHAIGNHLNRKLFLICSMLLDEGKWIHISFLGKGFDA